jgi:hypothetical protein
VVTPCDGESLRGILSLLGCDPNKPGFSMRRPESDSTYISWIWGRWNVGQRPLLFENLPSGLLRPVSRLKTTHIKNPPAMPGDS